jgi:hypothetical protein
MSKLSKALTAVTWMHAPSKYRGTDLNVLLKIAGLTTDEGYAFPTKGYLAASCGIQERNLRKITKRLKRDGVLNINGRKGHSSRYYLQLEALKALPLAVPKEQTGEEPDEETAETPVAAATQPTPTVEPRDAARFAIILHDAFSMGIPDAVIPDDWQQTWPAEVQKLYDAGHDSETLRCVARYAINHPGWSTTLLRPRGINGFVDNFGLLLNHFNEAEKRKAA